MAGVSWPSGYDKVFSLLRGVTPSANGRWSSCCPSHQDDKQSLSIKVGDNGKLVVKCHAPHGCTFDGIVKSLNLQPSDFSQEPIMSIEQPSKFLAAYDYRDEGGKLLFQVCRYEPKKFLQRQPNPSFNPSVERGESNKEYIYSMEGVRRVPYKLPEILAAFAQKPARWIVNCEGEKDCNLAWSNGIAATTNPMGAGKWLDEYSPHFKGMHVAIIPDNDPIDPNLGYSPGMHHAEMVAKSLLPFAKEVRIVVLPGVPAKGDFTDWWKAMDAESLDVNARKKRFAELVKAAPVFGGVKQETPTSPHEQPTQKPEPFVPSPPADSQTPPLPAEMPGAVATIPHSEWRPVGIPVGKRLFVLDGFDAFFKIHIDTLVCPVSRVEFLGLFESHVVVIRQMIDKMLREPKNDAVFIDMEAAMRFHATVMLLCVERCRPGAKP